jgi:hypothetical protein
MIEPGNQTIWQAFAATAGLYQDRDLFSTSWRRPPESMALNPAR